MLMQAIRDRAQSWISWVIISLLILVFAVWGINAYFEPDSKVNVAQVEGVDIGQQEYLRAFEMQRNRMQAQFGGNLDPELLEQLGMKRQILDQLVSEEVQLQKAVDLGFRVGDVQLASYINQIQEFQREGKFDPELYEQVVSRVYRSTAAWEYEQRRALILDQPRKGLFNTAFVTKKELDAIVRLRDQQRDVGYGVIKLAGYLDGIEVADADIDAYYNQHKDEFKTPEQVAVEYVELTLDALAKEVTVDEEALKARYEEQSALFVTPERRRARHILVQAPSDADDATVEAARKKAEDLLAKLKGGASFEELAKTNSDDPGSASQGGDLGFFGRGIMDKPFEDAAFALEKGVVSDVVRSAFGFHIIEVTDIEATKAKPFEEVRAQLEQDYRNSQAEQRYFGELDLLETLTFENPTSLEPAANQLGLTVQTSAFFAKSGGPAAGIAANAKVRSAAFDDDVLTAGNNSSVIEVAPNHVVVLRLKERRAATEKPLADVKEEIKTKLKREKATEKLTADAQAALERLKNKESPEEVLKSVGAEWSRPGFVSRDDPEIDRTVLADVFAAANPTAEAPVFGRVSTPMGDIALFGVFGRKDGDPSALSEDDRKVLEDGQLRSRAIEHFQALAEAWKAKANIKVFPDNL